MPYYAQTVVIGHAGGDPEIRYLPSGDSVANFSVAYSEKWKGSNGEPQEKTEWYRVSVFGPTVEKYVQPYLKKGDLVMIVGKMWTRKWTGQDGSDRYSTELVADRFNGVTILSSSNKRDSAAKPQQAPQRASEAPSRAQQMPFDDDIPF